MSSTEDGIEKKKPPSSSCEEIIPLLASIFKTASVSEWLAKLNEAEIPCGPIQNFEQVFSMLTVKEREMLVKMNHPTIGERNWSVRR